VVGNIDRIVDFGTGGADQLDLLGTTVIASGAAGAAVADYATALAAANTQFALSAAAGSLNVYAVEVTGVGVYVFFDTDATGTTGTLADGAVLLAGVTGAAGILGSIV
jgi:hypothetical protein